MQVNTVYKRIPEDTAGDISQFEMALSRLPLVSKRIDLSANVYSSMLSVLSYDQLDLKIYDDLNSIDVYNTFLYIYYKFKKGIYICVNDNKLANFLPFSNISFYNDFSQLIKVDPKYRNLKDLIDQVSIKSGYKPQYILPLNEWRTNNGLFRYDYNPIEGDTNIKLLNDMFTKLVSSRSLPDIEVYVNKKDFPILKSDETEAYNNIYGSNRKLSYHNYERYAPILSGSTALNYADIPIPTYEDWARITWQNYSKTFPNYDKKFPKIQIKNWNDKLPIAVFRGSSTGIGTTDTTNQRLNAFSIGQLHTDILDIGITKWNLRIRKHESSKYVGTIERSSYPLSNQLTLQQQSDKYKYILTLEGHVAAYRLSYELSSGSVVLLAQSKWRMWYYNLLKPYVHYVPVNQDLSNLVQIVEWCRNNDDKCKQIASNALDFYNKYLSEDGILDYLQQVFFELSIKIGTYDWCSNPIYSQIDREKEWINIHQPKTLEKYSYPISSGSRNIGRLDAASIVFNSKLKSEIKVVGNMSNHIKLCETNGFKLVCKTPINNTKKMEYIHETFTGLNTINTLVSKCPNFAYIYGMKDDDIYVEYISGQTLYDWILSTQYSFKELISIMVQINLALATSHNYNAFVHYSLCPKHIILQSVKTPISFDYNVGFNQILRYETTLIPVIIDFGKSRSITYDESFGLIDSGFINLYRSNPSIDTLTLLYSCADFIKSDNDRFALIKYTTDIGLPFTRRGDRNVVELSWMQQSPPLMFIDWCQEYVKIEPSSSFNLITNRGNCLYETCLMKTGSEVNAMIETISTINRQTVPTSSNEIIQYIIVEMINRRIKDLDDKIYSSIRPDIKSKYEKLKRYIHTTRSKLESKTINVNFPDKHQFIYLDTVQYCIDNDSEIVGIEDDWMKVWQTYLEVHAFDKKIDLNITIYAFEYFNVLASNNTCLMLRYTK
jgi:hypothetical protein